MHVRTPAFLILFVLLPILAYVAWPARGQPNRQSLLSFALRGVIFSCLILALAGLEFRQESDLLSVAFLLDQSDSYPAGLRQDAILRIYSAVEGMGADDQAGLIVFGGDALVERPVSGDKDWGPVTSSPTTQESDIAEAVQLGQAILPPGSARRIVLFSDGAETSGDTLQAIQRARSAGVDLIWAVQHLVERPEVSLLTVRTPANLIEGELFDLEFSLHSTTDTTAALRVFADGQQIAERTLEINPGEQAFSLPLTAAEPGFTRYRVQLDPKLDTHFQNNDLAAFSEISGPPSILIVSMPPGSALPFQDTLRPDEAADLTRALAAAGFNINSAGPGRLPSDLGELASYAAILLVDIPAEELSPAQLQTIQAYTRDLGGGLVVVGGPTSFGVGGYYRTILEEILPVEMRIKDTARKPPVTILFVIDRSGSMSAASGGVSKLELAKEAVARSVLLMFPEDQVGVIAFDDVASWVVPITMLEDPGQVIQAVGSIRSGGGTDILAGLQAAADKLPDAGSPVLHIVLLTDGGANPEGIPELVSELHGQYGITLSTVGIGQDAAPYLPALADLGAGRYHFAPSPAAIPSIFTQETTLVTRAYIVEKEFMAERGVSSPILEGIPSFPSLYGYVVTSPKAASSTSLLSPDGDPILSTWQYGLGKAAAFTSDATTRWGRDWTVWDGYPQFWSQMVRFVTSVRNESGLDVQIEEEGGHATVRVDAFSGDGEMLNDLEITANVVSPGQQAEQISLTQAGPGLYKGGFEPLDRGAYLINLVIDPPGDGDSPFSETIGWVRGYAAEYIPLQASYAGPGSNLEGVGALKVSESDADFFRHDIPAPLRVEPIWQVLLGIAVALLPVDIAVRRLQLSRVEIQSGLDRFKLGGRPKPEGESQRPERDPRLRALFSARQRARRTGGHRVYAEQPVTYEDTEPTETREPEHLPGEDQSGPAELEALSIDQPAPEDNLAAQLLARKKKRKGKN